MSNTDRTVVREHETTGATMCYRIRDDLTPQQRIPCEDGSAWVLMAVLRNDTDLPIHSFTQAPLGAETVTL